MTTIEVLILILIVTQIILIVWCIFRDTYMIINQRQAKKRALEVDRQNGKNDEIFKDFTTKVKDHLDNHKSSIPTMIQHLARLENRVKSLENK